MTLVDEPVPATQPITHATEKAGPKKLVKSKLAEELFDEATVKRVSFGVRLMLGLNTTGMTEKYPSIKPTSAEVDTPQEVPAEPDLESTLEFEDGQGIPKKMTEASCRVKINKDQRTYLVQASDFYYHFLFRATLPPKNEFYSETLPFSIPSHPGH